MRLFSFPLDSDVLGLGYLITITLKNGTVQRFTTAQQDITIGDLQWKAEPGVQISKIEFPSDGSVANAEINIACRSGGLISALDVKRGKYNGASILIHLASTL
jgi:hypothetical protein